MAGENVTKTNSTNDGKIKSLAIAAVFAALTFVATFIIHIPSPTMGYIHIEDTFVILSDLRLLIFWQDM